MFSSTLKYYNTKISLLARVSNVSVEANIKNRLGASNCAEPFLFERNAKGRAVYQIGKQCKRGISDGSERRAFLEGFLSVFSPSNVAHLAIVKEQSREKKLISQPCEAWGELNCVRKSQLPHHFPNTSIKQFLTVPT